MDKRAADQVYILAWHILLAGQARRFWSIWHHFGSAKEAWLAPEHEFNRLFSGQRYNVSELMKRRQNTDLKQVAGYFNCPQTEIIFFDTPDYPPQLMQMHDPPPVLFVRGNKKCLDQVGVALVGSRRATPYGLSVAEKLAKVLGQAEVNIISGLARGIDTAAHRGVLAAGGTTVAVLGCGIDVVYPRENYKLMGEVINKGAVVSEFPFGAPPNPWHFPVRNRIISGLSRIVVVVEAAKKSGALITAHVALEQGRDVMAVPGNITSALSQGTNGLIKQGATPVLDAMDILDELGIGYIFPPQINHHAGVMKLTAQEQKLSDIIEYEPLSLEAIVQASGLPAGEVMSALAYLEIKGIIRQLPGKIFAKA